MNFEFFNKFLLNKFAILLLFFIVFKIPLITLNYFILLIFIITLICSEITFNQKIKFHYWIFLIFLIIFTHLFDTKRIIEKHGIFLPNSYNENIYMSENTKLFKTLIAEFKKKYSIEDLKCQNKNPSLQCWKDIEISKSYSRSFDNIFLKNKDISRKIKNIKHSSIASIRIGDINNNKYNWFDMPDFWSDINIGNKIKRINAPYIVNYEFKGKYYSKSKICWKGKAIFKDENIINTNLTLECKKINDNFQITFLNFGNGLDVNIIKSLNIRIYEFILEISKYFLLITFLFLMIKKIKITNILNLNFLIIMSSLVLFYTINQRAEFSFGYQPLQGGMDGLLNEGYAREIYTNFLNLNFYEVFRGGENIYYFMPGLRYFLAIEKFLFGDNHFLIYLSIIFLPITFFVFLKKINFTNNISLIIVFLFIFLQVPHLGFSYQHYIKGGLSIYSETTAIFCFFVTMILLMNKKFFYSGLICSILVILRPNYFPAYFILILYNLIILIKNKEQDNLKFIYGALFILLMPLHNLFYGNEFIFFVNGSGISRLTMAPSEYLNVINNQEIYNKLILQLKNLISTGQHNILVYIVNSILLFNLLIFFIRNRINILKLKLNMNILIAVIAIFQLLPLLFFANTGRYAFFAWLLVTILNLITIKDYFVKKKTNIQFK